MYSSCRVEANSTIKTARSKCGHVRLIGSGDLCVCVCVCVCKIASNNQMDVIVNFGFSETQLFIFNNQVAHLIWHTV
jgi:hypothetical protein